VSLIYYSHLFVLPIFYAGKTTVFEIFLYLIKQPAMSILASLIIFFFIGTIILSAANYVANREAVVTNELSDIVFNRNGELDYNEDYFEDSNNEEYLKNIL
jgi:hypothetical protein